MIEVSLKCAACGTEYQLISLAVLERCEMCGNKNLRVRKVDYSVPTQPVEKSPEISGLAEKPQEANATGRGRFLLPCSMEKLYIGGRFHDTRQVLDVILGLHGLSVDILLDCAELPSSAEYCEKQDAVMHFVQISDCDSLDERRTKCYLRRELDQLLWGVKPLVDRQADYEAGLHSKLDYFS